MNAPRTPLLVAAAVTAVIASVQPVEGQGGGLLEQPWATPSTTASVEYMAHLQAYGDTDWFEQPYSCGTAGQGRRLEGFAIRPRRSSVGLGLRYMAHIQKLGDVSWVSTGQFVGTRGRGLRLEGFAIEVTGASARDYDIYYMAHLAGVGNTRWYKNGEFCGTRDQGRSVEAIAVFVADKRPPSSTSTGDRHETSGGTQPAPRIRWSYTTQSSSVARYGNCAVTRNVTGLLYNRFDGSDRVRSPLSRPGSESEQYLFLVAATVRDDGENDRWSAITGTADVGLHIFGGDLFDARVTTVRLFGPFYEGLDDDGTRKFEWDDYCTVRYNNFVLTRVSGNMSDGIRIRAIEGDDQEWIQGSDDVIYDAYVRFADVDRSGRYLTRVDGTCDIPGVCAILYFAVRRGDDGLFWTN